MRTPKSGKGRAMRATGKGKWSRTMLFIPKHGNVHMAMVPGMDFDYHDRFKPSRIDWLIRFGDYVKVNDREWYIGADEMHFMD